jgi:two-component SAPR family response regulator
MSINIRYPNITALSEKEQLAQVKSYLHQLVDQLNYALPTLGSGDGQKKENTYEVQGSEVSYYEFRSLIAQEIQKVENLIDKIKPPVKGVDYFTENEIKSVAKDAAGRISFTLDEDGNLYYEVEE